MITKELAENLYDIINTKQFEEFLTHLIKLKLDILNSLINLKDDESAIFAMKRIQGQAQMIDFIVTSFNKQNLDKILEKDKNKNNIGNTV